MRSRLPAAGLARGKPGLRDGTAHLSHSRSKSPRCTNGITRVTDPPLSTTIQFLASGVPTRKANSVRPSNPPTVNRLQVEITPVNLESERIVDSTARGSDANSIFFRVHSTFPPRSTTTSRNSGVSVPSKPPMRTTRPKHPSPSDGIASWWITTAVGRSLRTTVRSGELGHAGSGPCEHPRPISGATTIAPHRRQRPAFRPEFGTIASAAHRRRSPPSARPTRSSSRCRPPTGGRSRTQRGRVGPAMVGSLLPVEVRHQLIRQVLRRVASRHADDPPLVSPGEACRIAERLPACGVADREPNDVQVPLR